MQPLQRADWAVVIDRIGSKNRSRIERGCQRASFDATPVDDNAVHQGMDTFNRVICAVGGEVCVTQGGQNRLVTKNVLYIQQADTSLN